jgi:hypothetical protein
MLQATFKLNLKFNLKLPRLGRPADRGRGHGGGASQWLAAWRATER